ncbi:hypothetical protein DESC_700061 [Desulfosarcina cetonica]|nr:hypothetical protein DESC_700061 [Desulfosarcina cetonica]
MGGAKKRSTTTDDLFDSFQERPYLKRRLATIGSDLKMD